MLVSLGIHTLTLGFLDEKAHSSEGNIRAPSLPRENINREIILGPWICKSVGFDMKALAAQDKGSVVLLHIHETSVLQNSAHARLSVTTSQTSSVHRGASNMVKPIRVPELPWRKLEDKLLGKMAAPRRTKKQHLNFHLPESF